MYHRELYINDIETMSSCYLYQFADDTLTYCDGKDANISLQYINVELKYFC